MLVKTLPDGSKIEYQYDKNGNLTSVDDGETPLAWRYDIMDRVIESHAGWSSQYYEYDELGLLSKWQLPDANVLEYQRAKGGVLRAINLNDEVLTQHIFQNGLEMMRNQGELKSHFNYDDQGRLVNQSQMLEGREKQRRQYQYDGLGNLVQISDKQRGDTFYDYDPLSRLTAVRGNLDEQFTHDATGNLIPNHISLQSSELFDHAPGNQLKLHGDSHYEYDEFGRLVKESRGKNQSLVTGYEYDCQHRLIKVTMPDGSQAHYRYDAFGRRIEKRVMDKTGLETTTEFLWQGDNLIAEMTNSEQYQSYVYEPGTFRPLALLKGEGKEAEVYHYHLDQIGTPLDITTTQGETVWSVQYRAYGNVFKKTVAQIESPLRFQGQYFDAETGLHYNRHRYYNPNAGRFITIDPIGLAGGLNNYQYVPNPTGWVDPLGLTNNPCQELEANKQFRDPNPDYPTNPDIVEKLPDAFGQLDSGVDCSEIAENYYEIAKGKGKIIVFRGSDAKWPKGPEEHLRGKFNPPFTDSSEFNYPQLINGRVVGVQESYHALYTDGRYIYDGGLHKDGIPIGDYMKLIKSMNKSNLSFRIYNPDTGDLRKGTISGK